MERCMKAKQPTKEELKKLKEEKQKAIDNKKIIKK